MAKSRVNILYKAHQAHVIFRCHNREFLFKESAIKDGIIRLWEKYKVKYGISIFDFCIMDNHAHLLIQFKNQKSVSDFMRTVNSQIARIVNDFYDRDSQVLRERFRSPVIRKLKYFRNVIAYIWKNCEDVAGVLCPTEYKYCSLHYRLNGAQGKLLDNYEQGGLYIGPSFKSFAMSLLDFVRDKIFDPKIFENLHSVDEEQVVRENERYFRYLYYAAKLHH